jgi:hypothetical protein
LDFKQNNLSTIQFPRLAATEERCTAGAGVLQFHINFGHQKEMTLLSFVYPYVVNQIVLDMTMNRLITDSVMLVKEIFEIGLA